MKLDEREQRDLLIAFTGVALHALLTKGAVPQLAINDAITIAKSTLSKLLELK